MSESMIYEALGRRREEIIGKLKKINFDALEDMVHRYWKPYHPKTIKDQSIAAVDGGEGRKEFFGYTLYIVSGVSIVYASKPRQYGFVDIDILHPPSIGERISLFREILEGRAGIMASREADTLFLDGSLRSIMIAPRPLREETMPKTISRAHELFGENVFQDLEATVLENLYDYENTWYNPITSHTFMKDKILTDEHNDAIILVEYIEKLIIYRELLKKMKKGENTLVYVSKRSRAQNYFKDMDKELLPPGTPLPSDIVLFQWFTSEPGYSIPIIPEETSEAGSRFKVMPSVAGLREFYDKLKIAITYVRLVEDGPLLKLEIPVFGWKGELETLIEKLMDKLYTSSSPSGGYPYPLIEADKQAKIPRAVVDNVALLLGLSPVPSGREVLGEWR